MNQALATKLHPKMGEITQPFTGQLGEITQLA
jgi:hypothetical protein